MQSIGLTYAFKYDFDKALEYYERSLPIFEEIDSNQGIGYNLNCIGIIYFNRDDYDKALDYYKRSLAIIEKLDDQYGIRLIINNIGDVYESKGNYGKALHLLKESLKFNRTHNIAKLGLNPVQLMRMDREK